MSAASITHRKSQAIVFALICFGTVVLLGATFVYPKAKRLQTQREQIVALEMALKEQHTLQPFYVSLSEKVKRKAPDGLVCPPLKKLRHEDTREIITVCETMATQNGLRLASVMPLLDGSDTLRVDVAFLGSFFQFRALLLELGRLPYIQRIEEFSVQSAENGREIKLTLSIAQS
jgi:hypothetical protein